MPAGASTSRENSTMNLDYLLGVALSLALTGYLIYALLRPEKF
jgi:K+-transporting ATPase KdpF subunit